MSGDGEHRGAGGEALDGQQFAAFYSGSAIHSGQEIDFVNQFLLLEVLDGLRGLLGIGKRDKAINSSHDFLYFMMIDIIFFGFTLDVLDVLDNLDIQDGHYFR
jgi:hypothetical protein